MDSLLNRLGISDRPSGVYSDHWHPQPEGAEVESINPATGAVIRSVTLAGRGDYEQILSAACRSFQIWRNLPAPRRGQLIRELGAALRLHKRDLGMLVTLEAGKIVSEGQGEVQEMIDMCDFAVGLSRQLYGLTMPSERPDHRLFEQWHPLGPVGVITAFNFPVAVWAWNACLAAVCGDSVIWKPSPLTPLTAIAVQNIANRILEPAGLAGLFPLCLGTGDTVGSWLCQDRRIPLVSFTGSCQVGKLVARSVADRLGRSLLELGGNNAVIVTPSADQELALRAVVFAAVGTAGQRCTTLRRLIVHESIIDPFTERLVGVYRSIRIGDPAHDDTLMGPLIRLSAVERMLGALARAESEGGRILYGGRRLERAGNFVEPTLVRADASMAIVREETFAPILYLIPYRELDEAIAWQNDVDQGLSSAIFTERLREAEQFLSARGSDCGIANVNIGTSGAEIGGAFGGEKETGGGREAGSDAWKAYMRRQTCTVNFGTQLPLAQGIKFDLGGG
ncbi:MAG: aldehyde dehydrogenase family protein [Planctomycetes bacterium]|nr:aldehyde dehydrogenase family protein [Planctomycetota bacterium]